MIGEKIRAYRKLLNQSQVEFSAALGISQGNLSEFTYCTGRKSFIYV